MSYSGEALSLNIIRMQQLIAVEQCFDHQITTNIYPIIDEVNHIHSEIITEDTLFILILISKGCTWKSSPLSAHSYYSH